MFFLRELEERDCENFTKLLIEQFEQEGNNRKTSPKQLEARILKCINSKKLTILIAIQDCIKGYLIIHWIQELWADDPEALVSGLYVALDSRNRGIGKALLEEAVQKARNFDASIPTQCDRRDSVH